MTRRLRDSEQSTEPTSLKIGDFRANGSWNPSVPASQRGPRYRFVQSLIRARLAARISPAQIAEQIEASDFAEMFGELTAWKQQPRCELWGNVPTKTAADEAVKRCGRGSPQDSHWEQGEFVTGEDERRLPLVPAETIAAFVAGLAEAISSGTEAEQRVSDQEFFEGKAQ